MDGICYINNLVALCILNTITDVKLLIHRANRPVPWIALGNSPTAHWGQLSSSAVTLPGR